MLAVFQTGGDRLLLQTRGQVLQSMGLKVLTVERPSHAVEQIPRLRFDLAILCHSLLPPHRDAIAAALRRANPAAVILLVGIGTAGSLTELTAEIDAVVDPDPERLTEMLRRVLHLKHCEVTTGMQELPQAAD